MNLIALLVIVTLEAGLIFAFLRVHSRAVHSMEANRRRTWFAVRAYASLALFGLIIVPVGMYLPYWANGVLQAIEVTETSTMALLIFGIALVLFTTVVGFRVRR